MRDAKNMMSSFGGNPMNMFDPSLIQKMGSTLFEQEAKPPPINKTQERLRKKLEARKKRRRKKDR